MFQLPDMRMNMYVAASMMNWAAKCPPQHAKFGSLIVSNVLYMYRMLNEWVNEWVNE